MADATPFASFAHAYGRGDAEVETYVLAAVPQAVILGAALGLALAMAGRKAAREAERVLVLACVVSSGAASWLVSSMEHTGGAAKSGGWGRKPAAPARAQLPLVAAVHGALCTAPHSADAATLAAVPRVAFLLVLSLAFPALLVLAVFKWLHGDEAPATARSAAKAAGKAAGAASNAPLAINFNASGTGAAAERVKPFPKADFRAYFDSFKAEVRAELTPRFEMPAEAVAYLERMMQYNVPHGKLNRGLAVVDCARIIHAAKRRAMGAACPALDLRRVAVLGWCVEWMQAAFLVADDVMDNSYTRRGQACWFRVKEVGVVAINDAWLLLSQVNRLLLKYFGPEEAGNAGFGLRAYSLLVDLFAEVAYQTELGQMLDLTTQPPEAPLDLSLFTLERYKLIVRYKTAYYTFYLPVALGMITNGVTGSAALAGARKVCEMMGEYFQIQDDYLDCYGDEKLIGKVGTDIQDAKCSWLVVQALDRASDAQKATIEANYGKDDAACIAKIKQVYAELKLEDVFHAYEDRAYAETCAAIDAVCDDGSMPRAVFNMVLSKIYKRKA